jgi:lipopolysaccharide export system protein LptC
MSRRTLLITIAVLLMLAGVSQWLSRETRQEAKRTDVAETSPDFFITEFKATELDSLGRPTQRITGSRLAHFSDDRTQITQPHLTVFRPGSAPWEMTAAEGQSLNRGAVVHLKGGVKISREGPEATEIVTDHLEVRPQSRYAETAAPITLTTAQGRVQAVGMQAFLAEEKVVLQSKVRGTYELR